jgi:ribosomal protein S18 acetylase RimI-like enzyme
MLTIIQITQEGKQLAEVRILFREYEHELNADLRFQSFDDELENPLYKYGTPKGALLLAYWNNELAGCIALQPLQDEGVCEMKRLFVRSIFRKHKIGEALANEVVQMAKKLGYVTMKLDTLDRLEAALHLYKKMNFTIINSYYENPLQGVMYMEKNLLQP